MDLIKLWRNVGIENAAVGIKIPNDLQACGSGNPPAPFSKCSCRTSGYLSFKKGSRDLLATWQEAISQKNSDKISKERRVFESGSPMILGTKPWVLR